MIDMQKQIEELKRKAEQGSQKIQGEVLELELEQLLKDDQREAKADLAVIVSEVLPKGFHHFRGIVGSSLPAVKVLELPSEETKG